MGPQDTSSAYLGKPVRVTIDRPLGSRNPRHGFLYPINYGFIAGTTSGDAEALDAYVVGIAEPLATFEGICIAMIHRLDDDDDKLVVAPAGARYGTDEIRRATKFQEQYFTSVVILAA